MKTSLKIKGALLICLWPVFFQPACTGSNREQPVAQNGILDLRNWNFRLRGPVRLSGDWEFYPNRLLISENDFSDTPEKFFFRIPRVWNKARLGEQTLRGFGYATYRLTILLPENEPPRTPALLVPAIDSAYQYFVNGKRIAGVGTVGKSSESSRPGRRIGLDVFRHDGERINLVLQVSNFSHHFGGARRPIFFGPQEQIRHLHNRRVYFDLLLFGALLAMGLFYLSFFLARSQDSGLLYFGLLAIMMSLRVVLIGEQTILFLFPDINWEVLLKIIFLVDYSLPPLFALFLRSIFKELFHRKILVLILFCGSVFALPTLFVPARIYTSVANIFQLLILVFLLYYIYVSVVAVFKKQRGSILFFMGLLSIALMAVNDVLHNQQIIQTAYLMHLGNFVFIFLAAIFLAGRFSAAIEEVENLSRTLEYKVEERTSELENARLQSESARADISRINEFIKRLNEKTKLDEVLDLIFEHLQSEFGFKGATFYQTDYSRGVLEFRKTNIKNRANFLSGHMLPLGDEGGIFAQAVKTRRYIHIASLKNKRLNKANRDFLKSADISTVTILPIVIHNEVIGLILASRVGARKKFHNDAQADLAVLIEQVAGVVYGSCVLEEANFSRELAEESRLELEKSHEEVARLSEITRNLNETLVMDDILQGIAQYMDENYNIQNIWLLLADDKSRELFTHDLLTAGGYDKDDIHFIKSALIPFDSEAGGVFARACKSRKPAYIRRIPRNEPEMTRDILTRLKAKEMLLAPLMIQNNIFGMLYFAGHERRMRLSKLDIETIYRFCNQIAGAVYTSQLYMRAEVSRIGAEIERKKTDSLLQSILPYKIAEELKIRGEVEPLLYDSVTIMFTDFKGFSQTTLRMLPNELVEELGGIFSHFERISAKHGVEKLKTIGDAYMCAGGLPDINFTHPIDVCLSSLHILRFIQDIQNIRAEIEAEQFWEIRLGIHTGPVMAGVIGRNKLAYDVWGDTVNVASRMESGGEPGRVNISGYTYELVKGYFECEYRGAFEVKNRGRMDMYFLNSLKEEYAEDPECIIPNEKFYEVYKVLEQDASLFME